MQEDITQHIKSQHADVLFFKGVYLAMILSASKQIDLNMESCSVWTLSFSILHIHFCHFFLQGLTHMCIASPVAWAGSKNLPRTRRKRAKPWRSGCPGRLLGC